ncbi:MAG: NAD(P)/FAD-dependent oxidoreductase [Dehalococcoidia bacterium]|nr:NAD(P)/FAD-dependent oxidoreductase [Dehalococcoidia bacterium]
MAEEFDVIVIGAGVSGLAIGALLTKAGKKVVVLENMSQVGGRATSFKRVAPDGREWMQDLGGFHSVTMMDRGSVACVYREVGLGFDMFGLAPPQRGFLIFRQGRWDDLVELNKGDNREDFKKIINETASLKYEDIDQWDTISFRKWIVDRTPREAVHDWFRAVAHTWTTIPDFEEMSAGECIYTMKMCLESIHAVSSGSFIKGGSINASLPLADYIKKSGGDVRCGTKISQILVKDGRVTGVTVGEVPLEAMGEEEPEAILAPLVVSSVPIWNLFDLIPEGELPHWFVRLIKSYMNPDILHSLRYGSVGLGMVLDTKILEQMKYGGTEHRVAFEMPHTRGTYQGAMAGASDPAQAASGTVDFHFGAMGLNPELMKDKRTVEQLQEALERDLALMYPEIKEEFIIRRLPSRVSLPGRRLLIDGLARMPYYTGNFRIDHESPIEGLYLTGDTVRTRGCGIDAAVRSSIWCFNKITGANVPSFLPT